MKRGKPLKRSPMKKKPRKGGRMPEDVYWAVMYRNGGACEGGLRGICTKQAEEWHHRQRRQRGNDTIQNGAALCHACHHHITHVSPAEGKKRGLIVHSHHTDPGSVPMLVEGRVWCLLTPDGRYEPYVEDAA